VVEAETVPAWVASSGKDRRTIPVADRKRDSYHARNIGRSIHGRRSAAQNDAVSVSNTLQCHGNALASQKTTASNVT
jgi:hypothetical protein